MNVAEFIEWLKTQDQTLDVEIIRCEGAGDYKEVWTSPFDPNPNDARDFELYSGILVLGDIGWRANGTRGVV